MACEFDVDTSDRGIQCILPKYGRAYKVRKYMSVGNVIFAFFYGVGDSYHVRVRFGFTNL